MDLHALHLNYIMWLGRYNVLFPLYRYVFQNKLHVQTRLKIARPGRTRLRWACPRQTHVRWVCPGQTHLISFRSKKLLRVCPGRRKGSWHPAALAAPVQSCSSCRIVLSASADAGPDAVNVRSAAYAGNFSTVPVRPRLLRERS